MLLWLAGRLWWMDAYSLPPFTSIPPDVPLRIQPSFFPQLSNLSRPQALVVSIVPFPYVRRYLHLGFSQTIAWGVGFAPWKGLVAAEMKEFEGSLGAMTRGDVTWKCELEEDGAEEKSEQWILHVWYLAGNNQPIRPDQSFASCLYALLPICGEWNVAGAGMAAIERPFGFAVADDENAWSGHWRRGKLGAGGSWELRKEDRERTTRMYREFEESNQSSRIQPVRQATAPLEWLHCMPACNDVSGVLRLYP